MPGQYFDLLRSLENGVYLADCRITSDRVCAGWAWCDSHLPDVVELTSDRDPSFSIQISIPKEVQGLPDRMVAYFENEPVEFLIHA